MIYPRAIYQNIFQVPLGEYWRKGYRGILLDVDDTLVPKYEKYALKPEEEGGEWLREASSWVEEAKRLGFSLCIVSNAYFPKRLRSIAKRLSLPYLAPGFKPLPLVFLAALRKLGIPRDRVL